MHAGRQHAWHVTCLRHSSHVTACTHARRLQGRRPERRRQVAAWPARALRGRRQHSAAALDDAGADRGCVTNTLRCLLLKRRACIYLCAFWRSSVCVAPALRVARLVLLLKHPPPCDAEQQPSRQARLSTCTCSSQPTTTAALSSGSAPPTRPPTRGAPSCRGAAASANSLFLPRWRKHARQPLLWMQLCVTLSLCRAWWMRAASHMHASQGGRQGRGLGPASDSRGLSLQRRSTRSGTDADGKRRILHLVRLAPT